MASARRGVGPASLPLALSGGDHLDLVAEHLGHLEDRPLVRRAELVAVALTVQEAHDEPVDDVVDVGEVAGLGARLHDREGSAVPACSSKMPITVA